MSIIKLIITVKCALGIEMFGLGIKLGIKMCGLGIKLGIKMCGLGIEMCALGPILAFTYSTLLGT